MSRQSDYITEARAEARALWNAINNLVSLQREWNALNYSVVLNDFTGDNAGLVAADVGAAVFDTADAMVTQLNAGHATNLAKLL